MYFSKEDLKSHLNHNTKIEIFESIDSTNTEAKRRIKDGMEEDCIFVAFEQTGGRGRQGKSFFSPKSGIYFSFVLHPKVDLPDIPCITAAAAVAVADVLKNETKKDPKIKWVNDIFIDNKKVCGILTESVADFEKGIVHAVIVGIGINLTTTQFPAEIENTAGSVGEINCPKAIADIYNKLNDFCDKLPQKDFMEAYRKYSLVLNKTVNFTRNGTEYSATATNILNDGSLEVTTKNGEVMLLNSGEISIKL